MRRVWQKRKCRVQAEGYLDICHADESKSPTRVNLLTCQIKPVPDDKRGFDLISCKKNSYFNWLTFSICNFADNRTYHFQAEDESDQHAWMSVLINCKEMALMKAFDDSSKTDGDKVNHSLIELQQAIIRYIQKIPGNDRCCDCNSQNGEFLCRLFLSPSSGASWIGQFWNQIIQNETKSLYTIAKR